jgi:light-regulated signal transduction histidine kinase (bacteriophytochrome)
MNWTNRQIRNENGALVEILAVGNDITDLKQSGNLLMQEQRQLEDSNRVLESSSYSISHYVQAPLRAIENYSRMILKRSGGQFDKKTTRNFQVLMESAK